MSKRVVLTIDDIPQMVTKNMVDYLVENNIPAVMFAVGENIEKHFDTVVYAIKNGITVGNHSYSHPSFSAISYEEGIEEIEKTEVLINKAYEEAGLPRKVKAFRFPYIDKGGDKKKLFQRYLRENGFMKIDDSEIEAKSYYLVGHDKDIDVACSFDIREYNVPSNDMTFDEVMLHLREGDGEDGADIMNRDGYNIVLFHSHDDTDKVVPKYYVTILDELLNAGVIFTESKWKN
ncbi:MAG: polysaccharide deacetylase family protein [Eubacterium sp.]|nr:polysaccharide deacetylase family protein [Eubacterium sp.]